MAFIKTKLSTIRPNDLYDTLRLTYGFNNEEDQKKPGILAKPAEPVSDSDVVAAGFFDYMLTKSRERAAKLRAEAMEQYARESAEEAAKIRSILGITRSKGPTGQLSDQARTAMFSSADMRGTNLTMQDNAREAQEVFQPMITPVSRGEQPEMADSPAPVDSPSVDTRSNEMLDKAIQDVLKTVLDSDASDSTDSADGGAAPSGGKGIMSPDALTDDDMGLPTRSVPEYNFMLPGSEFRNALKEKEAESYSTIFGNSQKKETPFKDIDVTKMTMGQVLNFVKLNGPFHKYNKSKYNKNTTAIGKYQFVGATLRDLNKRGVFKKLGIDEDTLFDENTQDKLSAYQAIHRIKDRSKGTFSSARKEMRNEWEGFKKVDDSKLDTIIKEIADEIGVKITKAPSSKLAPKTSIRPKARPTD